MLLNDLSAYRKISAFDKSKLNEGKTISKRTEYDSEVDRLYNCSPVMVDVSYTYDMEDTYTLPTEDSDRDSFRNKMSRDSYPDRTPPPFDHQFSPMAMQSMVETEKTSLLTALIEESIALQKQADEDDSVPVTIYLPDYSPMEIIVKENISFRELIDQALEEHKLRELTPQLDYNNPQLYEIRIHEGDGEPDRDFPALGKDKLLRNFNLDDYCLCEVEEGDNGGPAMSISTSLFATSQFGSQPMNRRYSEEVGRPSASSAAGVGRKSFAARDRDDSAPILITPEYVPKVESGDIEVVVQPSNTSVKVHYEADTRLQDLLPLVSNSHRLRLYTDEYEFLLDPNDQKRLQLMMPSVGLEANVANIGATKLFLRKKVYADASRVLLKKNMSSKKKDWVAEVDNIKFTDETANAYQEWNVVKKNKFGRKQERVFGVDGKKVYNAKRGQLRGGSHTGVQRAERPISTIMKIEILRPHEGHSGHHHHQNNNNTFRITWMDDKDIYNIDYTCDTSRECAEIVTKIKYTLKRLNKKNLKRIKTLNFKVFYLGSYLDFVLF